MAISRDQPERSGARTITATVRKFRLGEEPSDFAYWQTQTPEARIAALEDIRREYHGWQDGFQPRLQRVCKIIKR
jgi:hypothetical protein